MLKTCWSFVVDYKCDFDLFLYVVFFVEHTLMVFVDLSSCFLFKNYCFLDFFELGSNFCSLIICPVDGAICSLIALIMEDFLLYLPINMF